MSKMSNIAMELDERAVELGFADHLEAMANGYDWGVGEDGVAFLWKAENEQEKAHEAWLKEKHEVLHLLESVKEDIIDLNGGNNNHVAIDELNYVIDFIEKGEM